MLTSENERSDGGEAAAGRWRQGWLLPPPRPLTERLGREFFLRLPVLPGVYVMHGRGGRPRRERVLYVGKSRNLRQRLNSYRHVHPDRDSRKTVRLVHAVESITFEICGDETAALLRENELLREHRPLFNRAHVRPEAHGYIGVKAGSGCLCVRLAQETDDLFEWHGAFKGGRRFALAALLRLLAQREHGWGCWVQLPGRLCAAAAPRTFDLKTTNAEQLHRSISAYLRGRTWRIVEELGKWTAERPSRETFLQNWRERDLEALRQFYLNGPRRNRRWRQTLGMRDTEILNPQDLDDLPIKIRLAAEPSPWGAPV